MIKNTLLIILVSSLLFSCGKYEEGPSFSLIPKTNRLTGNWKLKEIHKRDIHGDETLPSFINHTIKITKNNNWIEERDYYNGTDTVTTFFNNTWEWSDEKDAIIVDYSGYEIRYKILKLTSKELVIKSYDREGEVTQFTFAKN